YGRKIGRKAKLVAAGRDRELLARNRKPEVAAVADAGLFLRSVAAELAKKGEEPGTEGRASEWLAELRGPEAAREEEIAAQAAEPAAPVNPLQLLREIESVLPD